MLLSWFTYENLTKLGISLGILVLFLVLRKLFTKYIFHLIMRISRRTPTEFFTHVLLSFEKPFRWLFVSVGIYLAIIYSPFFNDSMQIVHEVYRSAIVIVLAWGLYNLTGSSSLFFNKVNSRFDLGIDDILVPFLSKLLRFVIVALSFSIVAQEFDYDVNGFVAGLGLGGLAFALAAKDTIGNFLGGIVIITEKPFTIGDWIKAPSVEGVVEDITFRSTKIRTFPQALVTVPNSTLANEPITNWTKMGKRQINFKVGVTYHTNQKQMSLSVKRIDHMLQEHDGIDDESIQVSFDSFSASSLDILINCFTKTTQYGEHLKIKQDINLRIMSILEEEGVRFAFPSQTIYVEQAGNGEEQTKEKQYS
ncbi:MULTISPECIES: mechanosensitive ion channel family protein [Bacillaceae]|uniref:Mechanosensitive ion channel family protein n=1 Tax=Metabacillus sediminis TaxID=3117746 RepID=A0ABZ2NK07_9BACI|nr:mechanosensitive ion channel family protein [Bacillus sp. SJS]KZZ84777.1 mechanosensitive ion channel protein [Bacillus sp. SJS]